MLQDPFRPCGGSVTFQEGHRGGYVPKVIETGHGLQMVAPETPYVGSGGLNKLYFIDTGFGAETGKDCS
ncbi:hypothetical protein BR93DRAFT_923796 [Coniochaeta sp. PMI_546]|nr:hypothetical protein BR93DRAFT_923796 [Coniochaeta sp. PMI_546]